MSPAVALITVESLGVLVSDWKLAHGAQAAQRALEGAQRARQVAERGHLGQVSCPTFLS